MEEKQEFRVTEKDVEAAIIAEQFLKIGSKTTICLLILNTGYEVIGTSSVIDPENFDFAIGKKFARERAVDQVWGHLGSIIQWQKAIHDDNIVQARLAEEAKLEAEAKLAAKNKKKDT